MDNSASIQGHDFCVLIACSSQQKSDGLFVNAQFDNQVIEQILGE